MNKIFPFVLLVCFLVGCSATNKNIVSQPEHSHFVIAFEKGICSGPCPVYRLQIYDDGTIFYNGILNVDVEGEIIEKINEKSMKRLVDEILQPEVLNYYDYTEMNSKGPGLRRIQIILNGDSAVFNYSPSERTPEVVLHLECAINDIVDSYQWTGADRTYCDKYLK